MALAAPSISSVLYTGKGLLILTFHIDASLLIQEIKAQRNAAIDEAAFAKAQVQHLIQNLRR